MKIVTYFIFIFFSISINAQYRDFWKTVDTNFHSRLIEIDSTHLLRPNLEHQKGIVNEMYMLAAERKSKVLKSRALQWDALNRISQFKIDSADVLLTKAIALIDTVEYSYDYARIKGLKEKLLKIKGDYQSAYKISVDLLAYYEEVGDKRNMALTYMQMGNTLYFLKDYEKAHENLEKANSIFKQIGLNTFAEKNQLNLSNILYNQGREEEAIKMLDKLLESNDRNIKQDTAFIINVMFSQCAYAPDTKHLKKYAEKNYGLAKEYGNRALECRAGISYAYLLIEEKKYNQALELLNSINKQVKHTKNINDRLLIYKNKLFAYSRQQIWDSAYYYSERFYQLNDSITGIGKVIEINKIEAREAINKFDQERKESELKRRNTLLLLLCVCCLSLGIISVIYFRNKKIKIQKQLKEVENKELNESLKNELLQKENLKLQINSKNRELTSNTLLLTEKNRILESLAYQIKELEFKGQLATKEEKELQKQIQNHLQTANEWEFFKLHFESVHPDFFFKLKEYSNSISENDLRLCAYIRIGMETKQIAQMLSVLPATINTTRYRLRKKLSIVGDISLEDYLRNL